MAGAWRSPRARMVLAFALLALVVSAWTWPWSSAERPREEVAPHEYVHPAWSVALTSDAGLDDDALALIESSQTGLAPEDQERLEALGEAVLVADLTGTGRGRFEGYWPPRSGGTLPPCTEVEVEARSAAQLPARGPEHAKVLLVWHGECAEEDDHDHGDEAHPRKAAYVYATRSEGRWVPVREWDVPTPGDSDARVSAAPLPGELADLPHCDGSASTERARLVVVEAWKQLCAEATRAGVELLVTNGVRTPEEQAALYEEGEEAEERGSNRVAYSDGRTCDSKHCDGSALDVEGVGAEWLHEVVGCVRSTGVTLGESTCGTDPSVRRLNRYGFSAPDPTNPRHLEFTLPAGNASVANCAPSRSVSVPEMVAQIFRCRLSRAGLSPTQSAGVVAEALVVSRCESLWNPRALALDGRFRTAPHPATGETVSEAGVFMLSDQLGRWAPEGEERLDPVKNINAAASIWLANRDWTTWPCATGAPSAHATGPVLPQHGGPELPEWALQY